MSASSLTQFLGKLRRFKPQTSGEIEAPIRLTFAESQAVAQVEPPRFELTRAARRFTLGNGAAITGIAPVTALPTTAAQFVLWNNDPRKTAFFEEIGAYLSAGTPAASGYQLQCALFRAPASVGATYAGTSIAQSLGGGGNSSKMIAKASVTITDPAAPTWYPLASAVLSAVAFPNQVEIARRDLAGGLAIPPNWGLALAMVGATGTGALFAPFATWVELETDTE
jgi:hypothetical protein